MGGVIGQYTHRRLLGLVLPMAPGGVALPAPRAFRLPLLDQRSESPTVRTFRFSTEGSGFEYRSNQAVRLSLPGVDDPWGAVRTFSLSSSPSEVGALSVTCKITDTPFKQALAALRPGEAAALFGPLGRFLLDPTRPAVFLAGGIGISPFRGMLKYAADTGFPHSIDLFYSARVPEELVFQAELDAIARTHPGIALHYAVTRPADSASSWNGRVGRIGPVWLAEHLRPTVPYRYYVAGLPEMVEPIVRELLGPLNVPRDDVTFEMFRGY
jgi:ferredoxin-NADP reductase